MQQGENINTQYVTEQREYRTNYQREYRKRHHEQMNDTERKRQRLNRNQQERQRSDRRRADNIMQALQLQNNNETSHSCNVKMDENCHEFFGNSFHNLQLLFRHQLDSLVHPEMCYMCQECYPSIKGIRSREGLMCSICQ